MLDRGVLLQAPVLSRIGALFISSGLPPSLLDTSILCLKSCLKLKLLKGRLEFHKNLFVVQDIFHHLSRGDDVGSRSDAVS